MEAAVQNITLIAGADLSLKQYYAVKINSSGLAVLAGAGENSIGILQTPEASGYAVGVMCLGISFAIYGAGVAAGANLTPDGSGKVVTAAGADCVLGIALQAGVANEIRPILLVTRTATGTTGIASGYSQLCIPIKLAKLADGDIVTGFVPGFAGSIESIQFIITDPATTPAKASTLNAEIAGTNVTGGVLALTSANCTPLGNRVAATAITAANTFTNVQAIDIEASATTTFIEGEGVLILTLKKSA